MKICDYDTWNDKLKISVKLFDLAPYVTSISPLYFLRVFSNLDLLGFVL